MFRMSLLGVFHELGRKMAPLPKICDTYLTTLKFDLPKEDPKIYKSRDTSPEFIFHRKSPEAFAMPRMTDLDCVLMQLISSSFKFFCL